MLAAFFRREQGPSRSRIMADSRFYSYGGSRGLQAPEYKLAINVALATGFSFMLLGCGEEGPGLKATD
jgi:hypothetical protein